MSTIENVFRAGSARLSQLLNLTNVTETLWLPAEFGDIWRHQLAAPLHSGLATHIGGSARISTKVRAATNVPTTTFRELLADPRPALEQLKRAKDSAKAQAKAEHPRLPQEISSTLYFLSAAVALVRCGQRITRLSDRKLREGMEWAAARPWLDHTSRESLLAAIRVLPA